ncbi:MAG: S46 family peptidase [Rikenellaceae bacterium]
MKRVFITLLLLATSIQPLLAEEGMWLPSLIGKAKIKQMKALGLKLSAEDLYDVNNSSLKDAIVNFGGCTAEIISEEGLIITNHHCGYGQIQSHSSVEHDYLTNGFWAMNKAEELPNPGLKVSMLIRMDDVTSRMTEGIENGMTTEQTNKILADNKAKLVKEATEGTHYKASIESMYYANQYFMFIYEVFEDVRLVGAPPSAVGKFGGDTDNWMWPRHTGDFSLFRIYASKDNLPAAYSSDNVPYTPKKSLTISTKGIKPGDFTMVYGYPGRTQEYITSDAVEYVAEISNPHKIKLRTLRLDVMNSYQSKDARVRIMYANKNASVSNAWKKWQGEMRGIRRLDVVEQKREYEKRFQEWAKSNDEYNTILPTFNKLYKELEGYMFASEYYTEAYKAIEITRLPAYFSKLTNKGGIKTSLESFYKDYYLPIDKEIAAALLKEYIANIDKEYQPEILQSYSQNIDQLVERLFNESIFTDREKTMQLLEKEDEQIRQIIDNDIATKLDNEFSAMYKEKISEKLKSLNNQINSLYSSYMKGMMEMEPEREFYPDANSTIRVAYGTIEGFNAADAVYYSHQSTLEGIMEKDNPDIYDYDVPEKLRQIYHNKDYGRWEVDGTVPVAFIASNHTSGGNSGSPVLNGKGELIGVNFDRCWESTMSDIKYDRDLCRNICVDIRYVLFLIEKLAGAGYLIDEMKFN